MELSHKDYQRLVAYIMYVKLGVPQKQIANILGRGQAWVSKWARSFNDYYVQGKVDPCLEDATTYLLESGSEDND